ncbi:hypothetical protein [Streptomyces odonnellii]|uniref:hypothetical protein n=1 Tax=Streptomyces odonnellii TaxID=1417980 RepID=UPI0006262314|nr:hypothetical protein [Streptomyces odonnellii]
MGESIPVSCPSCGRRHTFVASVHSCACGAPVAPSLAMGAPVEPVTQRSWAEEWVRVRCAACGREDHWPRPELGCPCGAMLRIPVRREGTASPADPSRAAGPAADPADVAEPLPDPRRDGPPTHIPLPRTAATPRPSFRPLTIRTADDAVTAAALYLRWLGFKSVIRTGEGRPGRPAGIDLRGPGVLAQVDPTTRPATSRAVECLWLNGLNASVVSVFFSLAGYADEARARADELSVPLFVLDLTGTPRPVNGPADELVSAGA